MTNHAENQQIDNTSGSSRTHGASIPEQGAHNIRAVIMSKCKRLPYKITWYVYHTLFWSGYYHHRDDESLRSLTVGFDLR